MTLISIVIGLVFTATGGAAAPANPVPPPPPQANVYPVDPGNVLSSEICASRGGTVSVTPDGKPICTLPKGCKPWTGAQLFYTTMLKPVTDAARKACTDQCGQLSTNSSDQVFCSKAQESTTGVRGWKPREPTH